MVAALPIGGGYAVGQRPARGISGQGCANLEDGEASVSPLSQLPLMGWKNATNYLRMGQSSCDFGEFPIDKVATFDVYWGASNLFINLLWRYL